MALYIKKHWCYHILGGGCTKRLFICSVCVFGAYRLVGFKGVYLSPLFLSLPFLPAPALLILLIYTLDWRSY